jgi:hypothetical protein
MPRKPALAYTHFQVEIERKMSYFAADTGFGLFTGIAENRIA